MVEEETKYEVRRSEELGRYLVAVRDIEPRDIIIREDPLISGPSDRGPKDIPICLGCSCVMHDEPMKRCSSCHWPVCSEECEKLPCHASNECQVFQKYHVVYPPPFVHPTVNKSIFILRCLLLKNSQTSSTSWEKLMLMSDNKDIRCNRPNCINADKKILENFKKFYPNGEYSEEEVIRISGIIDVNAHAFPLKINGQTTSTCNLYSKTSLMAHSCCPNASWSPDKSLSSLTLTIRANIPISKGEMISVAYDEGQLLVCTLKRVIPNEINGMFVCRCARCLDPTEMGTYIGALKCPSCPQGYLLPTDPVDSFSSWKCDNVKNTPSPGTASSDPPQDGCDVSFDDENVMEIIEEAESICGYTKLDFSSATPEEDESLDLLKEFVTEYSGNILHPNHYILQEVNVRILKGEYAKGFNSLVDTDLIQYLERCESLLSLSDILTPGYCEYRAFLQFHFSQGLLALERRKEQSKRFSLGYMVSVKEEEDEEEEEDPEETDANSPEEGMSADDHACSTSYKDCLGKYGDTVENLKRIKEMLIFLLTYFKEINPLHKLLEPLTGTIIETENKLAKLEMENTQILE